MKEIPKNLDTNIQKIRDILESMFDECDINISQSLNCYYGKPYRWCIAKDDEVKITITAKGVISFMKQEKKRIK